MKCRKCQSTNLATRRNAKNPNATDLYCKDCGAWQKFATKDEIRLFPEMQNDKGGWISVKDGLPDFNIPVLVYAVGKIDGYIGDSKTVITEYSDSKYGFNIVGWNEPWQYFLTDYEITHWMPLPEPPKEDVE